MAGTSELGSATSSWEGRAKGEETERDKDEDGAGGDALVGMGSVKGVA